RGEGSHLAPGLPRRLPCSGVLRTGPGQARPPVLGVGRDPRIFRVLRSRTPSMSIELPGADYISRTVATALEEDVGTGDLTAQLIPEGRQSTATVITREDATLCGSAWFDEVFRQIDTRVRVTWKAQDGDRVRANQVLCELS